jgi:hypothetical protein
MEYKNIHIKEYYSVTASNEFLSCGNMGKPGGSYVKLGQDGTGKY